MLAFLLVLAPALAFAQGREFPLQEEPPLVGPYVGALIGSAEAKAGCVGVLAGGGRRCDRQSRALGVFLGYRLSRHFGAELGIADLGEVEARNQGPGTGSTQSTSTSVVDGTLVGFIPLIGTGGVGLSAFAKVGVYEATLETTVPGVRDASNWKMTFSGGLQWDAARRWGLRASWQRYKGVGHGAFGNSDYDVVGVSGLWRF